MKDLKGSDWGIKVDKSLATESVPMRGTSFPKESGLNNSPAHSPSRNEDVKTANSLSRTYQL